MFDIPKNLNGEQLKQELRANGVSISDDIDAVQIIDGELVLKIANKDNFKAETVIAAHNGKIIGDSLSINEKLALVGLSIDDLKSALGL
jgi:hypothetical protein